MASLSPSPSGRRLSELLEEKQEPFLLDLHLLEKGCSPRLLDAAYDTALCWPAAAADPAVVLRRLASKKAKAPQPTKATKKSKPGAGGGGLLQLLLSKILRGGAAAQRKPAALQCSDSFKLPAATNPAAVAPSPCAADDHRPRLEVKEQKQQEEEHAASECYCSDDSDDDEKQQLSPVSVLDHPFEASPAHGHGKLSSPSRNAGMDVFLFRELLDAAYSPARLAQLLAKTDDLLRDTAAAAEEDEDDYYYGSGCRTSPESPAAAYWDAHRAELARVSELVASEVPASSRLTPADVRPERQGVGAEVEAAVLDALMQDLVADLLGGTRC